MHLPLRSVAVAGLLVLALGCSDDDPSASPRSTTSTTLTEADAIDRYCNILDVYRDAAPVDLSSVPSVLSGLRATARAAQAVADVAPDEVREAHELLATSAERIASGVEQLAPKTIQQLDAVAGALVDVLAEELGDPVAARAQVDAFADEECGGSSDG